MSDFVEQCRREWQRLGVADGHAEEMAADLTADLGDAEGEGVSAEELLGDPRAFASAWASERGVVPEPRRTNDGRAPFALKAFTAFAALGVLVAAVLLLTGEPRLSLNRTVAPRAAGVVTHGQVLSTSAAAPVEWILLVAALAALGFAGWLWSTRSGRDARLP